MRFSVRNPNLRTELLNLRTELLNLEPNLMLASVFPQMVANDFAPRGFARQVLKDLEMLQGAARERHLAMPMASQALTLYRLLVAAGHSELDASAVVTLYPKAST